MELCGLSWGFTQLLLDVPDALAAPLLPAKEPQVLPEALQVAWKGQATWPMCAAPCSLTAAGGSSLPHGMWRCVCVCVEVCSYRPPVSCRP